MPEQIEIEIEEGHLQPLFLEAVDIMHRIYRYSKMCREEKPSQQVMDELRKAQRDNAIFLSKLKFNEIESDH